MAWDDRIREGRYRSPSGAEIVWLFGNVSVSFDKKTTAFDFPDFDGTFVQDLGRTSRQIPLRMILSGEDYDQRADLLLDMLAERGIGVLQHPIYGTLDVVPMGKVSRRDDLRTAGNQAIFEVTFFETADLLFPREADEPVDAVIAAIDSFNEKTPEATVEDTATGTTIEVVTMRDRLKNLTNTVAERMAPINAEVDRVKSTFDRVVQSTNANLDTLNALSGTIESDLDAVITQIDTLIQLPARSNAKITDRLTAYSDLADRLTIVVYQPSNNRQPNNLFQADNLFNAGLIIGSVASVVNNQFDTRSDALGAADSLLALNDTVNAWRDDNLVALGDIDTGEVYQQVQDAVAVAAGFLVDISFTLRQERSIVLDRARTPLDLTAEFYTSLEDVDLNFFISSNGLVGTEILEVPIGRTVVYYV